MQLTKYVCQSVDEMPPLKKKALKRTKRVGYYLHIHCYISIYLLLIVQDIQILLEKFSEYEKFNRTFYASHR